MDTERERALTRCGRMLRLAEDDRTPEGERAAARNRVAVAVARWSFADAELEAERARVADAELPRHLQHGPTQQQPPVGDDLYYFDMNRGWVRAGGSEATTIRVDVHDGGIIFDFGFGP